MVGVHAGVSFKPIPGNLMRFQGGIERLPVWCKNLIQKDFNTDSSSVNLKLMSVLG